MSDSPRLGAWSDPDLRRERFRELYERLYPDVRAYCRRRTLDDSVADDAVGEVFLVVWRRLDDVPPLVVDVISEMDGEPFTAQIATEYSEWGVDQNITAPIDS